MDGAERREKSLDRQLRAFRWVRMLVELPGRLAGSEPERQAALRVEDALRELGFDEVRLEPVATRPRLGWTLGLHLGLSAAGCWLGGGLGVLLTALAAFSFFREFRRGELLLSRLLPAPPSRNVVARAGDERPRQRVVLTAHVDSAQAGWVFSERLARRFARGATRDGAHGPPPGPHALPEALLAAGAVVALASWLGAGGFLMAGLRTLLVAGLLAGSGLALQWAASRPSPGANDNASAVAAMLTCAEQLLASLPDRTELLVVGTGAEEVGCCGMLAFCERTGGWRRDASYFVNFECVGGGELHWVRSEGTLVKTIFPPLLLEVARRVAASGAFGRVTPTDLPAGTDGHVPARLGFPTVSLVALEADGVPRNYHRENDLPEALDLATVVRAADFGTAVARVALRGDAGPIAIV
ncbi:MAG: M28 family peptidase [Myxococcota bacterium]|nr:M28 family peptidase [Myxococcota bacterium]